MNITETSDVTDATVQHTATRILRNHPLSHIPELKVNPLIFEKRFAQGCSMVQCDSACCHGGVLADITERDKILEHAELIQQLMEPEQEKDPAKWFDRYTVNDIDFPSGQAAGTQVNERGCVFLKKNGNCVLQVAGTESGMGKFALKPFFCVAYPVVVINHELTLHDEYTGRAECCYSVPDGTQTLLDVCSEELEHMIGAEGVKELHALGELSPP